MSDDTCDVQQSPEIGDFAKALADAQAQMEPAPFDKVNPHFKSKYASLASIREACKPLAKHGLALTQDVLTREGMVGVRTTLLHSSGQWRASTAWIAIDRPGAQALVALVTYLRRTTMAALTACTSDDDDDGEDAERRPATPRQAPKPAAPAKASPARLLEIHTKLHAMGVGAKEAKAKYPDDEAARKEYIKAARYLWCGEVLGRDIDEAAFASMSEEDAQKCLAAGGGK